VNLGQGRPDFDGAPQVVQAYVEALQSGLYNQYAPGAGALVAREGVKNFVNRHYGLDLDPQRGIVMTAGATEAIFASIMGLIDPGDEVIIIEPAFDSYAPGVLMAGGVPVYVPLYPPNWELNMDELRAAFNPKTRVIILNTPHNPTGKVFSREELTIIADLCKEYDVVAISDEVYEHLIFDDAVHIPIATLPDMFERTITVGSAGKTFGMTGWKAGWLYGHPDLVKGVSQARQFITFVANHPAQIAISKAFMLPSSYYEDYRAIYTEKRDLMMAGVNQAGFKSFNPQGTYFVMSDFSDVFDGDDVAFSQYMITEIGVAVIPTSAFYSTNNKHLGSKHVRFAFCKGNEVISAANERMLKLRR
jgi:N-succinyldiaminopimelate aminotransferase|nr:aminotransferase class I/II-fold pyridoxal phosphate-dependent enzyme [Anaerolineae bacterium]